MEPAPAALGAGAELPPEPWAPEPPPSVRVPLRALRLLPSLNRYVIYISIYCDRVIFHFHILLIRLCSIHLFDLRRLMLRTTKPSAGISSAAAIAAAMTANKLLIAGQFLFLLRRSRGRSCCRSRGRCRAACGFSFLENDSRNFGIYFSREMITLMMISTTNTVPMPRSVFSPAFQGSRP